MGTNVKLSGVDEVVKLLKQVDKVSATVISRAAKVGAQIALEDAKQNCPESADGSHGNPPGTLKKSLKISMESKRKSGKRVYQIGPGKDGWYAHFVDYGFTTRGGRKVQGNGFLRNAVDKNRSTINDEVLKTLAGELKKLR